MATSQPASIADGKEYLLHSEMNARLYTVNRLDLAVRHVLGSEVHVRIESVLRGAMFLHWAAHLTDEQVAKVLTIDGVSGTIFRIQRVVTLTNSLRSKMRKKT